MNSTTSLSNKDIEKKIVIVAKIGTTEHRWFEYDSVTEKEIADKTWDVIMTAENHLVAVKFICEKDRIIDTAEILKQAEKVICDSTISPLHKGLERFIYKQSSIPDNRSVLIDREREPLDEEDEGNEEDNPIEGTEAGLDEIS